MTESVEKIMVRGNGRSINCMVHIGTNNADKEWTATIVEPTEETKQTRVGQIIL